MGRKAILITAIVSLAVTAVLGFWLIPWLKRLKYGQTINKIGPTWHISKEGTPTIGGLMFIIGTLAGLAVGYISMILDTPEFLVAQYSAENVRLFAGIGAALGFSAIGFLDDYLKVIHVRNLGLTARYKLVLQILVAALYLYTMSAFGTDSTVVFIPFWREFDLGIWYYVVSMFFIVGIVNSVNLTDGVDGLATTVTFFVSLCFIVVSTLYGYLGTGLLATAVAASCIGFLLWNFFPAKVFMGDTGSMFLGGAVVAMAYGVSLPALLILAGVVYLAESASVMLQVAYYKLTGGKRIFKMTPIHHHFEMSGYSEVKIVILFSAITLIGATLAVVAALMM